MNSITLKAEATAGSSIENAAIDAIALANRIGVYVEFNFNGVTCLARPNDNEDGLVAAYFDALHDKGDTYKFACDRT